MKNVIAAFILFTMAPGILMADDSRELASVPLFQKATKMNKERYTFALAKKAEFFFTPDRKSFYIVWIPSGGKTIAGKKTVFTLHGHASTAFDEFFLWHPSCSKRGYAIVALQWWFGKGEGPDDYYTPQELNRTAEIVLGGLSAETGAVLLHGFSRGSANTYGMAALSRKGGRKFFGMVLSNAGGAATDFPINREISEGAFGDQPLAGLTWVLYAGAKDENPDRDGIPAMERTKSWLETNGARIALFIKDSSGDHGGFHRSAANIKKALDEFEKVTGTLRRDPAY